MRKYQEYKGYIIARDPRINCPKLQLPRELEFHIFFTDVYYDRDREFSLEEMSLWNESSAKACRAFIDHPEMELHDMRCPQCGIETRRRLIDVCQNGCRRFTGEYYHLNGSSNASAVWENQKLEVVQ